MTFRNIQIIVCLLLSPLFVLSQTNDSILTIKEQKKARPVYINFSAGLNQIKFRDEATSPVYYRGAVKYFSVGYRRGDQARDTEIGVDISTGKTTENVSKLNLESQITSIRFHYGRLFRVNPISSGKMNYMAGGLFNSTQNIRTNPGFMNNAVGLENFSSLMASLKATRDFSKEKNNSNRKRELSLRLNIGVMNNSYRNGYIYTNTSSVLNEPKAFSNYESKYFSGFRMSTELDYTIFLQNKNAIKFSYLWDGFKSGGSYNQFGMTNNILKATFLFGTKK
ncbi:hypothetical protein MY04_0375 [Flammeovirga sp. MY04]|uniref:hypothetical protein n=1 Tax=Flammeovirga sp. MY04 TaxID=1191459 RepID=UPI000806124A|nr:hypothetical protein [Flammeovirga sp. MY04]ANQ47757.1 hypothetical protein MY04_0375 [Flammeovirga sp. MY04]